MLPWLATKQSSCLTLCIPGALRHAPPPRAFLSLLISLLHSTFSHLFRYSMSLKNMPCACLISLNGLVFQKNKILALFLVFSTLIFFLQCWDGAVGILQAGRVPQR